MEEKDEWVFFREIDWNCPKNNRFNVDTRDFHSGYLWDGTPHKDYAKIYKYEHFFFTEVELKELLESLFVNSGGFEEWRCLSLISTDNRVLNWNLKYLRIFRTEKGFIVCNSKYEAIPKGVLNSPVDKELL
jgi:hypothetical protein